MSKNAMTTSFLKECMSDALLKLMEKKEFSKITVDEITTLANVNRSTWFRNFDTKTEALTYKLVRSWERWAKDKGLPKNRKFTTSDADAFFGFNYENRNILNVIVQAGLQTVIYEAFSEVMRPQFGSDASGCYEARFYSYGLYGLLDEWIMRDYAESPEEMTKMFIRLCTGYLE